MFSTAIKNKGLISVDDSSDEDEDNNTTEDLKSNNSTSAPIPHQQEYTELEELDWQILRYKNFKPQIFEF